ncbi:MAG: hypothetical protein PHS64_06215 [Candidatus Omnitrophica bacterium]|nr:hypothetical protein [Candidatus Omnitrophota bacterium]
MKALRAIRAYLVSRVEAFKKAFDIRDVFFIFGLCLFGYGLWLLRPWLGFAAAGFMLMLTGYIMRDE